MNKCWKDSDISFFEKIPSHWDVVRFEDIFKEENKKLGNKKELELLTLSKKYGVIYRKESVGDVDENILSRAESFEDYKVVYPKMLVMNIMLAWDGVLDFSTKRGFVSPAYNVFKSKYDISYFKYLLKTNLMHAYFRTESKGITNFRLRLYSNNFLKMKVFIPPLVEQKLIADYLDQETSKIDRQVELLERKTELLSEYRQSLIYETVTRGLDKNVRLKDSGIEWIGEIPEYWEVRRVKDVCFKGFKSCSEYEGEKFYLSTESIKDNMIFKIEDIVTYDNKPSRANVIPFYDSVSVAKMKNTQKVYTIKSNDVYKYIWSTGFYFLKSKNIESSYLNYFLKNYSFEFQKNMLSYGVSQESINDRNLNLIWFTFNENKYERLKIVQFLDEQCLKIDKKVKLIKKKIELLKEYRQSLIYECVTGKKQIG